MNTKPNKENIVTEILLELEKGTERAKCLAKVGKKLQLSNRTFDRHWKTANERYAVNQESKQKALAEVSLDGEKEALKKAILSKHERMLILTQIALGEIPLQKPIVCAGEIKQIEVVPNWMDRKNAISELNKMDGSYAPIKQEHSGEIKGIDLSVLTTQELIDRAKAIKKIDE